MKLVLETKKGQDKTGVIETMDKIIIYTPPIGDQYWEYRVKLYRDQYLLGFKKFGTIGVGFAEEVDWNTNLPASCGTEMLLNHIWHNHKYRAITKEMVTEAIQLIKDQIKINYPEGI